MTTAHGLPTTDQKPPLVTTYLEMRSPEQLRPKRYADARFQVRKQEEPNWVFNRDMYFRVGEQWQWIDKRPWTDEQWKQYAAAPELRTFGAYYDDARVGYYELRSDAEGGVEIAYFGLLLEFVRGVGPKRVWVHTCNRDHPQALANYQARGMIVYKIEESGRGNAYE